MAKSLIILEQNYINAVRFLLPLEKSRQMGVNQACDESGKLADDANETVL